jgi:SagB-type dehydrogenase family enzyme
MVKAGERYRRSPALTLSWSTDGITCLDCRSGVRTQLPNAVLTFLDVLGRWTTARQLMSAHPEVGREADVRRLLDALEKRGLVECEERAEDWPWHQWTPDAAAFHFGTRGGRYPADPLAHDRVLRKKAKHNPPPAPVKAVAGPRLDLPPPSRIPPLSDTLLARRTWRVFGTRGVSLDELSTLLQLTWGVQKWGTVKGQGQVALKTSPSGGARHPIEAYVLAPNVDGVAPGVYHYDAARHGLVDLNRSISAKTFEWLVGNQYYFAGAGAAVVMAAVFGRTMWRYPSSRVYRSILIEAGHLGQTFCLAATALGLAPFGTIAFRDAEVDRLIGVDGINEGALYIVGVGTRPPGDTPQPGRIYGRRQTNRSQTQDLFGP